MSDAPFFSVVIPTHNRAALLANTLGSVFAQDYRDFELIVVDDGSTDDTWSFLKSFGDRLTCLRQENAGPSAARNLGIARARGRYVCTLDSDDLWFPWSLATFREAIELSHEPTLVTGTWRSFRDEAELAGIERGQLVLEEFRSYVASSGRGVHVSSGVTSYLRKALVEVGGFDCSLLNAEDHDLALRLSARPGFTRVKSPTIIGYRQHTTSVRCPYKTTHALHTCIGRYRRGHYPGPRGAQAPLVTMHTRSTSLACLKVGRGDLGWSLYLRTIDLNAREGRLRYLFGFPVLALLCSVSRSVTRGEST